MRNDWFAKHVVVRILGGIIAISAPVAGQPPAPPQSPAAGTEFDIASVKVHVPAGNGRGRGTIPRQKITSDPGRLTMVGISGLELVQLAYNLPSIDAVKGAPEWLMRTTYDITGTTSSPASKEAQWLMLRTLLKQRFSLICHTDSAESKVYNLLPGPRLLIEPSKEPDAGELSRFLPRLVVHEDGTTETLWTAKRAGMDDLAKWLTTMMTFPVFDTTGLTGAFDISLSIPGPPVNKPGERRMVQPFEDHDVIVAVQRQLGLRMEQHKGKVQFLMIDQVSKPDTDN